MELPFLIPEIIQLLLRRTSTLILLSALLLPLAYGAEITDIEVKRIGSRYLLVSTTHFDAEPEQVFRVLLDYDGLAEISKTVEESRYLEPDDDGQMLVYTRMRACVVFLCKTIEKIEHLDFIRSSYIKTTAIPERSDVRYSQSEWELAAGDDGGTQVIFRLELEPDFWVPPLFGTMVLKRALINDGASAVNKIEALAQKLAESNSISSN